MTRLERLAFSVLLGGLLAWFVSLAPVVGGVGAATGVVLGLAAAGRVRRLRTRMDARLGADAAPTGFRPKRLLVRVVAQLVTVGGVGVVTLLVPFVGDELFAGGAALVTGLPLALTVAQLRR